mgnify:CR=1 FL=1
MAEVAPNFERCSSEAAAAFGDAKTARFEGTHESGQTVVDKRDAWRALLPYLFMNLQSTLYYYLTTSGSYGEGDKETLPLALEWATRFLDPPPKWTDVAHKVASVRPNSPTKPEDSANGMIQHDLDGRPLSLLVFVVARKFPRCRHAFAAIARKVAF